ncbi:hypothetical protein N7462_010027 [Penicillium macrosclerotiorum]|uniref:uncharacterized protein n=1 Tax=Penicillium macrosclerotiorum TaxID=303699 RepID=UPI0025483874|nr:uncharacterized protein N7462_010027 [Penicillium macrosclerotiorum]KAJ5668957.1 hypothetical protein N7462_010027 [Penicillium macrosclerotiorum]
MAEPPPTSSRIPPGTPLNDPTRPHGDSMEEQDPQGTRKRPRLDSGSGVSPSVSIDGPAVATPTTTAPASDMDTTPDHGRLASKVTINMKSPGSDIPLDTRDSSPMPPGTTALPPAQPDTTPSNVISLSSSPAQSPEIEVAELEDMNQDPNMSNWRPLEEALREKALPDVVEVDDTAPLIDSFPRVREHTGARESLNRICLMIDKLDSHDAHAVSEVKIWIDACVQNLDRLTVKAIMDDRGFWESFPTLVEIILRRKHELLIDDGTGKSPWDCLEEFILGFVQLALHMIRLEIMILRQLTSEKDPQPPESLSQKYLNPMIWILSYQTVPFYSGLEQRYPSELTSMLSRAREKALGPSINLATTVAEHASLLVELIPRFPQLSNPLLYHVLLAQNLIDSSLTRTVELDNDTPVSLPRSAQLLYDTTRLIDDSYREWVTKKAPWATSDFSEQLLRQLPRVYNALCLGYSELVDQIANDLSIQLPADTTFSENTLIIFWGWKFAMLKKHIMEGRMELRVHGVETMQSDLVSLWKQNISPNPKGISLPFIQYLVRFILDNKIVDYLVGVDSHPQLISRSSNIIGFLIVTNAYTNKETDIVWKTVTESQDSRIVSEVLLMLSRTFYVHATGAPALLYICTKILQLPLDRFDARILEFCDSLLDRMYGTPSDRALYEQVDTVALQICARLIRESTAAEYLSVEQKKQLQDLGSRQLTSLIKAGISEVDRMDMYERCIQDISEMNQFTVGSIQVLSSLVPRHDTQEMWKLATDFDLTRLVITDVLHTVNSDQVDLVDGLSQHGLISRITMLFRLIEKVPDTITPELGKAVWDEILLSKKLDLDTFKAVWVLMINALKESDKSNPFLNRCINEYLPAINQLRNPVQPPPIAAEHEVVLIPGMDRIWNFILTAPPGTIEAEATKYAIEVYLDHAIIRNSLRSAVEATHIAAVERCLDQLKSAAATLKTPKVDVRDGDTIMDSDIPSEKLGSEELRFRRSLFFLHQLLGGLRARPQYSSPKGSPPILPERPLKGNPIDISWQSFNGNSHSKINTLRIGELSTAAELVERLTLITRFSKFTAISGGQRVGLLDDPEMFVKDMKHLQSGLLILRKAPDAQEVTRDRRQSLTSVDSEVLKHFDELYELLALDDGLAREIFDFLVAFPPQDRVLDLVRRENSNAEDLFPFQKPFIAFYSFNALLTSLREEAVKETPQQSFVSHSIKTLVTFLMSDKLSVALAENQSGLSLAKSAVECLLVAATVYSPTNETPLLVEDPASLVRRLLYFIETARSAAKNSELNLLIIHKLMCNSFAVLIEVSIRDPLFWDVVKQEAEFGRLLQTLLLEETKQPVRNDVLERIRMTYSPSKFLKSSKMTTETPQTVPAESPVRIDMLATIWNAFVQIIPRTSEFAAQSSEFFKIALWVFRSVAEKSPRDVIFSQYLRQWSEVMLQHRTEEFVGREQADNLILGFALLLEQCLELADSANVKLETFGLAEKILGIYLFPDLSPETNGPITPQIPVIHNPTRQRLYNIVKLLCKQNDDNVTQVMEILEQVVPRDVSYGPNWCHDRSKMIRAPEGYAGLKNLSNTCYLNSLMTQLFMNVEFRDFLLKLDVVDFNGSQKLLGETQKLFAWMQDTWTKSVDPQDFVESIQTYDNEAIDVTIQMDVDEFYNLLFDRWEAQVVDQQEKKKFRSFYGGQLVQQIKSKECDHISERLEPFSAIQCDIKGKACLEESLQAYVEGEIMQGDNKYSCTGCDRHVDAVKRACLKDVPDNLIFHLKRFDFDMVTMMRSKINDEFRFPQLIDMTPYKVEYLSDPTAPVEPDFFELVGVLVHTGTAESGHYYSYTRERPGAGSVPLWVEFNDADVSNFDPSTLADQCFGGQAEASHAMSGVHVNRVWNAYMLFYQRVSTMEKSKEVYSPTKPNYPARVPLPTQLSNRIAIENEIFIRTYCLLDPYYALLVPSLLRRVLDMDPEHNRKRQLEPMAMDIGLDTLEQLVARTKDHMGHESITNEIWRLMNQNPRNALRLLEWFSNRATSLRNLLLKVSHPEVKNKAIALILASVTRIQNILRSPNIDDTERKALESKFYGFVEIIVKMAQILWSSVQSIPRVWEEYFDFLIGLLECGEEIIGILLENGVFLRCLEILWIDNEDQQKLKASYPGYSRLLDKGRRFSYRGLMILTSMFFGNMDLSLPPVTHNAPRPISPDGKFPLSLLESKYVKPLEGSSSSDDDGAIALLMKILQQDALYHQQAIRDIMASFLAAEPQADYLRNIEKTLDIGLRLSPAELCIPFLDAASSFCAHCPDEVAVIDVVNFVAKGVDSINNSAGAEHLEFFRRLCNTSNDRAGLEIEWFTALVQEKIPDFCPTLLIDTDRSVRHGTSEMLQNMLFLEENESPDENARARSRRIARELTSTCMDRIRSSCLESNVQTIESRLVHHIMTIVNYCLANFFDDENDEDQQFIQLATAALSNLEQMTVDVPDDLVSESDLPSPEEWEATSAMASDSEMGIAGSP